MDERSTAECRFSPESSGLASDGMSIPGGYPEFGLTHVVGQLQSNIGIKLTTAHRQDDPSADFPNFTFSASSLTGIDVVWLIGSGGPDSPGSISEAEIAALTAFMQQGGGIFATGDHADYGAAMAAGLPRLQDMRLWNLDEAPPAVGPSRVTSIQPSSAALNQALSKLGLDKPPAMDYSGNPLPQNLPAGTILVPFENQSAETPAPLMPKWFIEGPFPNPVWPSPHWEPPFHEPIHILPFYFLFKAHPLLQMDDGSVLQGLPGHMHEGVVPGPQLPGTYVGNANYPSVGGLQPTPDVVAKGTCLNEFDWPQYDDDAFVADYSIPAAFSGPYGVIGTYDGWPVNRGRIAVDSTFHHFFDINLIGDQDCKPGDPRGQGYTGSPAGVAALAQIDNYHRNLVTWLGHGHIVWMRFYTLLAQIHEEPALHKTLASGADNPADNHLHLGLAAIAEMSKRGTPAAIAIDTLLDATGHQVLPPWFRGNTGGRHILSAREATHLFANAVGAAFDALHHSPQTAAPESLIATIRTAFGKGIRHALRTWPAKQRPPSSALRTALEQPGILG
jgi:hypothetical protein